VATEYPKTMLVLLNLPRARHAGTVKAHIEATDAAK
jgi:hypothetical protein